MSSQADLHWDDGAGRWLDASGNDPNAPTYTTGLTGRTKQEIDDYWAGKGVAIANAGYAPPPVTGVGSVKVDADKQAAALAQYLVTRAAAIADITGRVEGSQAGLNAVDAAARNASNAAVAAADRAENERVLRILSGSGYRSDSPPVPPPPPVFTAEGAPPARPVLSTTIRDAIGVSVAAGRPLVLVRQAGDEDGTSPLLLIVGLALVAGVAWYLLRGGGS